MQQCADTFQENCFAGRLVAGKQAATNPGHAWGAHAQGHSEGREAHTTTLA